VAGGGGVGGGGGGGGGGLVKGNSSGVRLTFRGKGGKTRTSLFFINWPQLEKKISSSSSLPGLIQGRKRATARSRKRKIVPPGEKPPLCLRALPNQNPHQNRSIAVFLRGKKRGGMTRARCRGEKAPSSPPYRNGKTRSPGALLIGRGREGKKYEHPEGRKKTP